MKRYDARLNGMSIGSFDTPEEALDAICREARKRGFPVVPDIIDTHVPMPFDRSSIIEWCRDKARTTA
jgi:hypothetical protein